MVNMYISKVNTGKTASTLIFILPKDMDQTMTVQGIVMYHKLRYYTLPEYNIFQQYMVGDDVFRKMCVMYHGMDEYKWVMLFLSKINED